MPLAALLGSLGYVANSVSAGEGSTATLTITKVVDGEGPTGGFVIDYSCEFLAGSPGEGAASGSLNFDAAGPGQPESQVITLPSSFGIECHVEETDANGADATTYACNVTFPNEGGGTSRCDDDQTVVYFEQVLDVDGEITVTNTFEADVLPDDEDPPPPAVDPDVVVATPPFTG